MELTGAQAILECLKKEGVKTIFGYPGGQILPFYDALYSEKEIKHILVRHEQGAAHAADGFARVTGQVGVCVATSGPGATNLVTGIANAYMDSIPMVAITGQVGTMLLGRDSFQEADITGITSPITKHNYLIKKVEDLPRIFKEAFYIARTGRPGPVLIDIPRDVQNNKFDFKYPEKVILDSYKPKYEGHPKQISSAAKAIIASKKPLIYAGGGVISSNASKELTELAKKCKIPVTTTLMGRGSFSDLEPLSLGMLGMHGTVYANYAVQECDLLIAIGARFDDRVTGHIAKFAPKAKHIHIDIDPAEIGKNVKIDIPIVGDIRTVLKELNIKLAGKDDHNAWLAQIEEWKKKYPLSYKKDNGLKPQYIIEQIYEIAGKNAIIATEVGQHQMWASMFYKFTEPRSFVTSGGLGTMGFGLPASIGAQVGRPDKVVFDISGDGSIFMNIQELVTAVNNKLPIKIAVLNNSYLGMVRQWQEILYDKRYSSVDIESNPDLCKVAEAFGCATIRIDKAEDVKAAIEKSLTITDRPTLLDFHVAKEENVLPFVPPGQALNEMLVD
jgi:acetolactate synthase I/II/III large subunit